MSNAPILSVIIVSYNTREMTLECLQTLGAQLPASLRAEIFVVDNGSADGSAAAVRAGFPAVIVIENPANTGFGAANNLALRRAAGRYLLLLNSDAFPKPGAISALIDFLERNPGVGVAGPRLLYPDGSMQQSCYRFTTPASAWLENLWLTKLLSWRPAFEDYYSWDHASQRDVDFVIGACLLLRREVYEQTGGFDERFFMYQEEADWQKRIRAAGWRIVFTPGAEVVHIAGASSKDQPVRINRHLFDSLDKYMIKHHGIVGLALLRGAMIAGCSLRALAWGALALIPSRREKAAPRARLHAWLVGRQLRTGLPPREGGRA
jgi:N-acetylglucosaminyl-diphospho-decaprenol L-rhamnosyltransferase